MGSTRQGLVRMSLVLGMAASVCAVADSPSGASTRSSEHHVSRHHVPRASSSRHHASHHRPTVHLSWLTPKNEAVVSGKLKESVRNCVVSAKSRFGIAHVTFYRDGRVLNTDRHAPYSCLWTTTSAVEGSSHMLKAVARDEHGRAARASVRVTVHNPDTGPPRTRITSGPSGTIGTASASFSFSSSEAGSSFECRLDGGTWAGCSSPDPDGGLADGSHGFEVRATDGAGNTDPTPASRSFTVDTSPPTVSWSTPGDGDKVSGQLSEGAHNCVVSASSSPGIDYVSFYLDGALLNTELSAPYSCTWDTTTAVEGSAHTLEAVAFDTNGSSSWGAVSVTVENTPPPDFTPPETTITSGPSGTIATGSVSFSFSSSEAGSSFECRLDGGTWAGCSSPTPYSGLADGSHGFEVRATDGAANTDATPASRSFTVDTSSPGGDGYPSLTSFNHDGDFDSGCQLVGGGGGWDSNVSGSDHPGTASIVSSPVEEGSCAVKYSTPAGTGSGRAELAFDTLGPDPTLVYEELLYIPSEANNGPDHGSLTQTKMSNNPCYNGGLTLPKDGGGNLGYSIVGSCSADSRKFDLGSVPKDQWIAVKAAEKFGSLGSVQIWIDPDGTGPAGYVEKLSQPNIDTTPVAGAQVKMRQGLYHDQDAHESHIYGDGFHMDCTASC